MLIEKLASLLFRKKKTIAVAESCTGGLISHTLTNISGSSKYFKLGLILYSSESKSKILKVDKKIIEKFGAVSEKIALLMAQRVKKIAKANIGLSVTGFAGPTGGTKNNPKGTVYIGLAVKNNVFVKKLKFTGNRVKIKNKAKDKALELIRLCLDKL